MEVHHHPHVSNKSFKAYFLEFLMIFLAVTLGFIAENIREHFSENKIGKELARSLYKEVYLDSVSVHQEIQDRLRKKEKDVDQFIDFVKNGDLSTLSENMYATIFSAFLRNYVFEPTDGILSQLRNSGGLRYLKSSQLQEEIGQLSVSITKVRLRNLTEYDWLQSTVKPFLLKHLDFSWFQAYNQHTDTLSSEEARQYEEKRELFRPAILNPDQFNRQEAMNMAAYYLMIIRGTRSFQYADYVNHNHRLLETLRKEYAVK